MDFSRTASSSNHGIDGRFGNINPVCHRASPNLLHDMPAMQFAERDVGGSQHGIKFGGAAGLSGSGQFQTGAIISCDFSGRSEKCLNRLTKVCSYVNMSDY